MRLVTQPSHFVRIPAVIPRSHAPRADWMNEHRDPYTKAVFGDTAIDDADVVAQDRGPSKSQPARVAAL